MKNDALFLEKNFIGELATEKHTSLRNLLSGLEEDLSLIYEVLKTFLTESDLFLKKGFFSKKTKVVKVVKREFSNLQEDYTLLQKGLHRIVNHEVCYPLWRKEGFLSLLRDSRFNRKDKRFSLFFELYDVPFERFVLTYSAFYASVCDLYDCVCCDVPLSDKTKNLKCLAEELYEMAKKVEIKLKRCNLRGNSGFQQFFVYNVEELNKFKIEEEVDSKNVEEEQEQITIQSIEATAPTLEVILEKEREDYLKEERRKDQEGFCFSAIMMSFFFCSLGELLFCFFNFLIDVIFFRV